MRTEIHIFSGLGGWWFSGGTRTLEFMIDSLPFEADAQHHRHQAWEKVADGIITRARKWGPPDVCILTGHSYGALRCQQIATRLAWHKIPVHYLAGIDPTALPRNHPPMLISRNVLHVDEFYAGRGWPARARKRDPSGAKGGKYIYPFGIDYIQYFVGGGHVACAKHPTTQKVILNYVRKLLQLDTQIPEPTYPIFTIPSTKRKITKLIWHCTATAEGKSIGDNPALTIDRWHKARGWDGIGYHAVTDLDGETYLGRDWDIDGAHVRGHNKDTLGLCYVGGVAEDGQTAKDTRTAAQRKAMLELTRRVVEQNPSITRIVGHNQFSDKACPSFVVTDDELGNIAGFTKGRKI